MNERTLILIKPDGVQRLLVGQIVERYEAVSYTHLTLPTILLV